MNSTKPVGRPSKTVSAAQKRLSKRSSAAALRLSWSLSLQQARRHERPRWQRTGRRCERSCDATALSFSSTRRRNLFRSRFAWTELRTSGIASETLVASDQQVRCPRLRASRRLNNHLRTSSTATTEPSTLASAIYPHHPRVRNGVRCYSSQLLPGKQEVNQKAMKYCHAVAHRRFFGKQPAMSARALSLTASKWREK